MNSSQLISGLCVVAATLLAKPVAARDQAGAKLEVAVSIPPQAFFVQRVGGAHVRVQTLVGPGQSPHTYEPSAKQIAGLRDVRIYFRIGVDFENAIVPRLARMFQGLKIVDTRAGVPLRRFTAEESAAECHGAHGSAHEAHSVGAPDPHFWLNPLLARTQARTICEALAEADPAHADEFRRNLVELEADLVRVHEGIAALLKPLEGQAIFVFHPAFGYFTDAYGLRQVPVEIEGKEPGARQLARLIARAKAEGVKVIFVQPQFPTKSAAAVAAAIGGAVVPMDDLAADYLANLEQMAEKIKAALVTSAE